MEVEVVVILWWDVESCKLAVTVSKKKTTFRNNIAPFTRLLACHAASVQRAPGWGQPVTVL